MNLDFSQYLDPLKEKLEPLLEKLENLPYYPYSVIGIAAAILLLLVLLLVAGRKRKSSSAPKKRDPHRAVGAPVRGMPVDGLLSQGDFDQALLDSIKNSPMGRVVPTTVSEPPKPEVDPVLIEQAVKACQEKFQETYIEMYIGLGLMSDFEGLRTEVGNRFKDGKETYHAMSELKMTPEGVILMQMASVAGNILQSGEHHVSKGQLGIHGQELLMVYRYALNTMQEKGFASQDDVQIKLDYIERKVQELGN